MTRCLTKLLVKLILFALPFLFLQPVLFLIIGLIFQYVNAPNLGNFSCLAHNKIKQKISPERTRMKCARIGTKEERTVGWLFSTCSLCGKKKLSFSIGSDGLCSACHKTAWQQKGAEITRQAQEQNSKKGDKEMYNVSAFVQPAASGYTPPLASSNEPVMYLLMWKQPASAPL